MLMILFFYVLGGRRYGVIIVIVAVGYGYVWWKVKYFVIYQNAEFIEVPFL